MYLLDTNVVSELRRATAGKADPRVVAWAASVPVASLFLSAITVLELEWGVLRIERRDPAQGALLRAWLEERVLPAFSERMLPVDVAVARRCARLHVPDPRSERDALIAATALTHGLIVVTRNGTDFRPTGVETFDPWTFEIPSA
jgi:predicted nucleic acid-binding protein